MKMLLLLFLVSPRLVISQPASVYISKGFAKGESGDFKAAIAFYNKAIELEPGNGDTYYYRALAKIELEDLKGGKADFKKAIIAYTKTIERDPKNATAYLARGNVQYNFGKYTQALEDYNKAIELDSSLAVGYFNRGLTEYVLDKKNSCCADMKKAREMGVDTSPYEKLYCQKE